jgi:hypothetical protein
MGEKRNAYRILVGKPEGNRRLRSHRRRCEDNIKIGLQEKERESVDWIDLSHDRDRWRVIVNAVVNHRLS